jgi:DNA-binding response OmpR family regulator
LREQPVANPEFTVLLIEDDREMVEMYRLALVAAGRAVVAARDGDEGLRMASSEDPDFIVLDVRLPGLNGLEEPTERSGQPLRPDASGSRAYEPHR